MRIALFGSNSRERFEEAVLQAFSFVLDMPNGCILSHGESYPRSMDSAVIEIAGGALQFRIMRHRGEIMVEIASSKPYSGAWEDAASLLRTLKIQPASQTLVTIDDFAAAIRKSWPALESSLA